MPLMRKEISDISIYEKLDTAFSTEFRMQQRKTDARINTIEPNPETNIERRRSVIDLSQSKQNKKKVFEKYTDDHNIGSMKHEKRI